MTQPDPTPPAASPESDRPVEAFPPFTERPPEAEVWRRARQDYLGGDSAPVVAERYGLAERTVRRRASIEGWRKTDVAATPYVDPPPWGVRDRLDQIDFLDANPEYEQIAAARQQDQHNLLFTPAPDDLRGYAFRRACEAAALNHPGEAAAWLRVQRLVAAVPDPQTDAFPPDDHMRAAMLRAMRPSPDSDEGSDAGSAPPGPFSG